MTVINANSLAAVDFKAPALPPPSLGLFQVVDFTEVDTPRWFAEGVLVERTNFDGDTGFGVWGESWCVPLADIEQIKEGARPDRNDTPFTHLTAYGYAHNPCGDLRQITRDETEQRAMRSLLNNEQTAAETSFAARLAADVTADAVTTVAASSVVVAVSHLETEFLLAGVTGYIHANPAVAAFAASSHLLRADLDGTLRTPLGHIWVFGAGYVSTLVDTMVGTTRVEGWRTSADLRDTIEHDTNEYVAIAERSMLLAYEKVVAATTITP